MSPLDNIIQGSRSNSRFRYSDETIIMILGENNLISVSHTGVLLFVKRLDYGPMCFYPFVVGWYYGKFIIYTVSS